MKNTILMISMVAFAFNLLALSPSRDYEITPDDYAMNYKEVKIPTDDEFIKLYGWFFPSDNKSSRKLIIMTDDGEGNMADNLELVGKFLTMGYSVMMYDFRGYGKSDDFTVKPIFFTYKEFAMDIQHVIDYCKKYHATLNQVDLWGHGMGAGLTLCAGMNNMHVKRVVADGVYDNFEEIKKAYSAAGSKKLTPIGHTMTDMEPTFSLKEKSGGHLFGIMFVVAENDPITSLEDLKTMTKNSKYSKFTWFVRKGADDNSSNYSSGANDYYEKLKAFLTK